MPCRVETSVFPRKEGPRVLRYAAENSECPQDRRSRAQSPLSTCQSRARVRGVTHVRRGYAVLTSRKDVTMRVLTDPADCDILLDSLDGKLAGAVNPAAEIRQSLDTQDTQRRKELMIELTRLAKEEATLRARQRRKNDLRGNDLGIIFPCRSDRESAGRMPSQSTLSRQSAAHDRNKQFQVNT
jgi:hypothetical protein